MDRKVSVFRYFLLFFYALFIVSVHSANNEIIKDGEVEVDSLTACASLNCKPGENCVKRRFWCKHPPCPDMLYCSKTQRESFRGPITCDSVRCSRGHNCLVRVRQCRWDQKCRQQIARCVSEREYHDGPASCAGFQCQTGHQCILRESPCSDPPCKLVKSCAKTEDVRTWHDICRNLGCPSKYECFLRRPLNDCPLLQPCKYIITSDCTITNANKVPVNPSCQGWVCPRNQECLALQAPGFCDPKGSSGSCEVNRTCHGSFDTISSSSTRSTFLVPTAATNIQNSSLQMRISEIEKGREGAETDWQKTNATSGNEDSSLLKTIEAFEKLDTILTDQPTNEFKPIVDAENAPTPISRRDLNCNQNESLIFRGNWGAQTDNEPWKPQFSTSIYRTPVYVRSVVKKDITESGVEPACQDQRTDSPVTEWLNHLRLKTGVDAVDVWAKHSEENKERRFNEWLESVKSTLGPSQFQIWLREFRKSMSEYPAFQNWLSTIEEVSSSAEKQNDNWNGAPESPFIDDYNTSVIDHDESSTFRAPLRNESKLNSLMGSDEDPLTVSVAQRSSNLPLERNTAGHPRINYGLNPRNSYQQMHRGYVKPYRNLRPVEWKNESLTSNSTQHPFTEGKEIDTKISKLIGHSIADLFPKSQNKTERNSSHDYSAEFQTEQDKSLDNDTRLDYDPTNHSQLLHETKENAEKFAHTPVGLTDEEDEQFDGINSTLVSPVDQLAKSKNDLQNNTRKDSQLESLDQDAVSDAHLKHLQSNEKPGEKNFSIENNETNIPTHGLGDDILPESGNRKMLQQDVSVNNFETKKSENPTTKQNLFAPVVDGLRVTSPWNALRILDPPERTYYALLRFPLEQANDEVQILGYPLIMSRISAVDPSKIFPHVENDSQNPKAKSSLDSREQTSMRQQILRKVLPQISDLQSPKEKGEQIDSRNEKSSSEQKLERQHERVTFGNPSEFVSLQDKRTVHRKQYEQNDLSSYGEIIPNTRLHKMGELPFIPLQSLPASLESSNPNNGKAYQLIPDPKSSFRNQEDVKSIRGKQTPTQQKQKSSLPFAFSNNNADRRFQNIDPTLSSFKNWYQREGVTPYYHDSFDSTSLKNTPISVNAQNKGISDFEDSIKEYYSDSDFQEYLDTYLDAFVKDAVSKLLVGESLKENDKNLSSFSKNIHDTISEAIDYDEYEKRFPQHIEAKNVSSSENHVNGFRIPQSIKTVQKINDIRTDELQQATITPISDPPKSPILISPIGYQLYDCEEDEKLQLQSPSVGIDKNLAIEDEYSVSSKIYGVEEDYYYEDEMEQEYLDKTSGYQQGENLQDRESNTTNYYESHYYEDEM